jgi:hypothetical protein
MSTSSSTNQPPNFLSLPLEIRQEILSHAFADAFTPDIMFNRELYSVPFKTCQVILSHVFADELARDMVLDAKLLNPLKFFMPNTHILAVNLSLVHPQLSLDMAFVLKQALAIFQNRTKRDAEYLKPRNISRSRFDLLQAVGRTDGRHSRANVQRASWAQWARCSYLGLAGFVAVGAFIACQQLSES